MKTQIILAIIVIILGIVSHYGFYELGKSSKDKEWKAKIKLYKQEVNKKEVEFNLSIMGLEHTIDSLKALQPKIVFKYLRQTQEIDSILSSDTTRNTATGLYREKLALLEIKPDTTQDLTVREIGWGAKNFIELQEKRELLFNCYDVVKEQDNLVDTLKFANQNLVKKIGLLELENTDTEPSWFYRRFGFFLGAGYGYDFNTKQVNPQVGIYFGINLF